MKVLSTLISGSFALFVYSLSTEQLNAATFHADVGVIAALSGCSDSSASAGTVSCSAAGIGSESAEVEGQSIARSDIGSVGVAVNVSGYQPETSDGSQTGVFASARATFVDDLLLSVNSGYFVLNVDLFGFLKLETFGPGNGGTQASANIGVSLEDVPMIGSVGLNSIGLNQVLIPFNNGSLRINLQMIAQASCIMQRGGTCNAFADFYSSARVLASSVLDDNGDNVSDWFISSSSGLDYTIGLPPHMSAIPLPAGGLLLLSSLGAFALLRRRKIAEEPRDFR